MTDIIKNLFCPECGEPMRWKNRASMTVVCENGHSKRVKSIGKNSIAFRDKPGPKNCVRKSWRVNGTIYREIGEHLASHGVGGQDIVDAGVLAILKEFPIASSDCV